MFANLAIQLCIISFWKEIIQENVCECTKICEIRKRFPLQTIPDTKAEVWYTYTELKVTHSYNTHKH